METGNGTDNNREDKEVGDDQERGMEKNKEEFWNDARSSVYEASDGRSYPTSSARSLPRSLASNHAEPRRHGHPRPKKDKKKKSVQRGRVDKQVNKRQLKVTAKRKPKPRHRRTQHKTQEAESIYSGLTAFSTSTVQETCSCSHCGRRRRSSVLSRRSRRCLVQRIIRSIKLYRGPVTLPKISVQIQAGPGADVLSPLLVQTHARALQSHTNVEMPTHAEVTPEMIVESLRRLTMLSQDVDIATIINYMKRTYPVNTDNKELIAELSVKLRIAAELGLIVKSPRQRIEYWSLSSALQRDRKLKKNHVNLFWKIYSESMTLSLHRIPSRDITTLVDQETDAAPGASSRIV